MLIDFLFLDEGTCYFCKEEPIYENSLCRSCLKKLDYVSNSFKIGGYEAKAIYFYNDFAKKLIGDYKFERKTSLSKILGEVLYSYLKKNDLLDLDFILPSPISRKTLIDRGFDHIKMITDYFIEDIGPTYLDAFKKVKNTRAQHDLSKEERVKNLTDAFVCEKDLKGRSVLLIDDLITTGNTAKEIIRTLESQNVGDIKIVSLFSERRVL